MGRPGVLRKPTLSGLRHREFNDALHRLHLQAGRPSLTTMAKELRTLGTSRSSIHDAFSSPRLPSWDVVKGLTEILVSRAPGLTVGREVTTLNALWCLAAEAEQSTSVSISPATREEAPPVSPLHSTETEQNREGSRDKWWALLFGIEGIPPRSHFKGRDPRLESSILGSIRKESYEFIDSLLESAGVKRTHRHGRDFGDGLLEFIDASTPLVPILRFLLAYIPIRLRDAQRARPATMRVRFRIAVSTAWLNSNQIDQCWAEPELNDAAHLLDSHTLRAILSGREDVLVLAITDPLYREIVEPLPPKTLPTTFEKVRIYGKGETKTAWVAAPMLTTRQGRNA